MGTPQPLPAELRSRVFSRAEIISLGYSDSRLRAADVEKLGHGLYRLRSAEPGLATQHTAAAAESLRGIQSAAPQSWFSYQSAFAIYGLPSLWPAGPSPVHISLPHQSASLKRLPWVQVHRPNHVPDREIRCVCGLRVSSPERLFLEMARVLALADLVVLGDQLVRIPRKQYEDRSQPWTTVRQLRQCLNRHPSTVGIVNARAALEQVRVGADSPPETLLRLSLIEAGLPEPDLQYRLDPTDPQSPQADMAYRHRKLALQYEGAHHFTAEQQAADQKRNWQFAARGWRFMLVNRVDLQERFCGVISRLSAALGQ